MAFTTLLRVELTVHADQSTGVLKVLRLLAHLAIDRTGVEADMCVCLGDIVSATASILQGVVFRGLRRYRVMYCTVLYCTVLYIYHC